MAVSDYDVSIPDDASEEEAAAIAAAVRAHVARLEAEAAESGDGEAPSWEGKKWAFSGRVEALGGAPTRVPDGAPTDAWSAAARRERF